MDLDLYFKAVDFSKYETADWAQKRFSLGALLQKNQQKLSIEKADLLIMGVEEDRNSVSPGQAMAPDKIREHLYSLNRIAPRFKILDLGNLKIGKSVNDTYFALKDIVETIVTTGQTMIVLGGSQDLTFGINMGFEDDLFNLVSVDPKFDFIKGIKSINSESYLTFVSEKQKNLLSYTSLGYQNYFTDSLELDHFRKNNWDALRLGQIRYDMASVEPILRDANVFSFDINSVRSIDAPGQYFESPNGLYSEEACQIARYAGLSDKISIAGFFNFLPPNDVKDITARLTAHIVWHFMEGFYNRAIETPHTDSEEFNQFIVEMEDIDLPLLFLQSRKTGRWWMEIRNAEEEDCQSCIVPCTEEDYLMASKDEIPDRWWKNIRKLQQY